MARANLVALMQLARQDALTVDVGAVVTSHVDETALRGINLHHEVNAREIAVLQRQLKMGVARSADEKRVMPVEAERSASVRAGNHGERDAHRKARARAAGTDMTLPCFSLPICAVRAMDGSVAVPRD